MTDLLSSSQFWLLVSIGFYALGVEIQKKTGSAVCNPLLIASILVGALLIATGTPYQTYEESGKLISFFLTPATVALAIPIYRKLDVLLKNLLPILLGAFVGSMVSIGSVLLFSHLFGLSESTTLSLVPKSVTTPIAVAVAEMLGGVTSITAIAVVITGIIGAIILPTFLKCIGVRNPVQMGLSIGTASHAVGAAKLRIVLPQPHHGCAVLRGNAAKRVAAADDVRLFRLRNDNGLPGRKPVRLVQLVLLDEERQGNTVQLCNAVQRIARLNNMDHHRKTTFLLHFMQGKGGFVN